MTLMFEILSGVFHGSRTSPRLWTISCFWTVATALLGATSVGARPATAFFSPHLLRRGTKARSKLIRNQMTTQTNVSFGGNDIPPADGNVPSPTRATPRPVPPPSATTEPVQEWDVDKYQEHHSFVWKYGTSLIDLVFSELDTDSPENFKILDIGCGSGELTAQLATRVKEHNVVGLDADPKMVQTATKQCPHVTFLQADARDFDVGEANFDIVFSNAALHWIPSDDIDRTIACISRALKPGGRLIVEFGGKGNVQTIEAAIQRNTQTPSLWYFPTVADFTSRLEDIGDIETTTAILYDRPTVLPGGKEGMKNWLSMFGQHFWQNVESEDAVSGTIDKIEAEIQPVLWDGESWVADYRRLRVVGQKSNASKY